jgi:hypothetical protein
MDPARSPHHSRPTYELLSNNNYERIVLAAGVVALPLIWLLLTYFWGRQVAAWIRIVIVGLIAVALPLPASLFIVLQVAHRQEVDRSAGIRAAIENYREWNVVVNEEFDRANDPYGKLDICTNPPLGEPDRDFSQKLCYQGGGVFILQTFSGTQMNAYNGGVDSVQSGNFYAEVMVGGQLLAKACGIGVATDTGPTPPGQARSYMQFVLEGLLSPYILRPTLLYYDALTKGNTALQSAADSIPFNSRKDAYDNAPRRGWFKLGLFRQGDKFEYLVNDHVVLTYTWRGGESGHLKVAIVTSGFGPHATAGTAGSVCRFDNFKVWEKV